MDSIIITTPEEVRGLISEEIARAIQAATPPKTENPACDTLGLTEAVDFITSQGIRMTRSALYNRVYKDAIPYRKFGKKLLFLRSELLDWIAQGTANPAANRQAAALRIAENAGRKEVRYE